MKKIPMCYVEDPGSMTINLRTAMQKFIVTRQISVVIIQALEPFIFPVICLKNTNKMLTAYPRK